MRAAAEIDRALVAEKQFLAAAAQNPSPGPQCLTGVADLHSVPPSFGAFLNPENKVLGGRSPQSKGSARAPLNKQPLSSPALVWVCPGCGGTVELMPYGLLPNAPPPGF